jgi:hypothetical protein
MEESPSCSWCKSKENFILLPRKADKGTILFACRECDGDLASIVFGLKISHLDEENENS